jgi:NADPH2:quinone reductase
MKAAWYRKTGPAYEVLEIGELETPQAGPGEVRVKLRASAVSSSDVKRRAGKSVYSMEYPLIIPNSDGAGVIDQVGPGVPRERLGERVWIYNGQRGRALGTCAEYIALPQELAIPLPEDTNFFEGACLGISCMTAHICVFGHGPVSGKTVLVTGGAGAVGHYAIQLAKWGGATVVATVSSAAKENHAREGGANYVLNYKTQDVSREILAVTEGQGVDRIVEVDFGKNLEVCKRVLGLHGMISVYASAGEPEPVLPVYPFIRKNAILRFVLLYNSASEERRKACSDITAWLLTGLAKHTIAARFPLSKIAEAHRLVESGEKIGTVIVDISE